MPAHAAITCRWSVSVCVLASGCGLLGACPDVSSQEPLPSLPPQAVVTFLTAGGEIPVAVEIADEPTARARGLMYRDALDPLAGMVFVFAKEEEQVFWMKNTYLSLDLIFVDSQHQVVGVIARAEPLSERPLTVGKPSRFVVEVNAGFADKYQVSAGTKVTMANVPQTAAR